MEINEFNGKSIKSEDFQRNPMDFKEIQWISMNNLWKSAPGVCRPASEMPEARRPGSSSRKFWNSEKSTESAGPEIFVFRRHLCRKNVLA